MPVQCLLAVVRAGLALGVAGAGARTIVGAAGNIASSAHRERTRLPAEPGTTGSPVWPVAGGRMLGDHISVHYASGRRVVVWVLASEPVGASFREAVYARPFTRLAPSEFTGRLTSEADGVPDGLQLEERCGFPRALRVGGRVDDPLDVFGGEPLEFRAGPVGAGEVDRVDVHVTG